MADLKMPDINNVLIAGNLTRDPSLRKTSNGTPVANFSIVSNRKFKDNNGQWREDVCYVGVVAWYRLAEICFENLRKGSTVLVDGELQSRNLRTGDGFTRNIVEIKARRVQFLDKKVPESTGGIPEAETDTEEKDSLTAEAQTLKDTNEVDTSESEDIGETSSKDDVDLEEYDFGYKSLEL